MSEDIMKGAILFLLAMNLYLVIQVSSAKRLAEFNAAYILHVRDHINDFMKHICKEIADFERKHR